MRLIDADELAHALDYDAELCAKALDDMAIVGKVREDMQFEKDCKQNCIWYISEQPTVKAITAEWITNWLTRQTIPATSYGLDCSAVEKMLEDWKEENKIN